MNLLDFPLKNRRLCVFPVFSHVSSGMRKSERTSVCDFGSGNRHLPMEIPKNFLFFLNQFSVII